MGDSISQYVIGCYYKKYLVINSNIIIDTVEIISLNTCDFARIE